MEQEYFQNFLNILTIWIPKDCKSVRDAQLSIGAEKLKRIDWLNVLLTGLEIAEGVVSIMFPQVAPFIAIANIVLSGGVRIYKKLKNNEPIIVFHQI